ncbi:hypothetical protein E1295_22200 [Nonomuraea mesophila]|uniref:Uncharacterized protein n=1 Tax=Nonomuraea mesophila TaxID=2530382 RepID=A0A4V6PGF8_9ACTN|nr:hypothetical protein E1295_22200 [Nonomuraea mesophila]
MFVLSQTGEQPYGANTRTNANSRTAEQPNSRTAERRKPNSHQPISRTARAWLRKRTRSGPPHLPDGWQPRSPRVTLLQGTAFTRMRLTGLLREHEPPPGTDASRIHAGYLA